MTVLLSLPAGISISESEEPGEAVSKDISDMNYPSLINILPSLL